MSGTGKIAGAGSGQQVGLCRTGPVRCLICERKGLLPLLALSSGSLCFHSSCSSQRMRSTLLRWPSHLQAPLAKDYAEDNERLQGVIDTMQTAEQVVGDSKLPREARVGKHKLGQVEHQSFDHFGEVAVQGAVHTPDAPHHAAFGTASGSGRSGAAVTTPGHSALGTSSATRTTQEVSDLDEARVAAIRADALEEAAEEADALLEDKELQAQAAEEAANAVEAAHGAASALRAAQQAAAAAELDAEQAAVAANEAAAALEVDTYGSASHLQEAEVEASEEDVDLLQGRTLWRQQGELGHSI